ncbi:MAG TPA: hypothetical protein VFS33_04920 [Gemmatimonadales bacterium]|nr:hypothetical protein [Gemmatimonadales bacterium]
MARYALAPSGRETLKRLVVARRAHLLEFCADWDPDRYEDLAAYLRDAVPDLVPDVSQAA